VIGLALAAGALAATVAATTAAGRPDLPLRALDPPALPGADDPAARAGEIARRQGFDAARAVLESRLEGSAAEASLARLQLGLLAHAHEQTALAERLLADPVGPAGLDDWRLYVLADSTAALGHADAARAALEQLLERHPDSPLGPRAQVRLATLAWEQREVAQAQARIAAARADGLPPASALELERLAWQIGLAQRDGRTLAEAGRRLLVEFPVEASKLRVVDVVAAHGGPREWQLWLTPPELVRRAEALLDAELPAGALTTLAAVPAPARDLGWRLLEARALTASQRGAEALAQLDGLRAEDPAALARLEWERARAASEAATVRRGRTTTAEGRARLRGVARENLLDVVRAGPGSALAAEALRLLAADYLAEERLDEALAALRQLAVVAPADGFGARPLWERGWSRFERGDPRGAVACWSEVGALYPKSSHARSARYWTARAHERLGDAERARALYRDLAAADTADFYARQARARLAGEAPAAGAAATASREPWPEDPAFERARRLSDLGLDALAATELEAIPTVAGPARSALEALIAARQGDRRSSLRLLKRAFPGLGTAHQASVPEAALALYYPLDFQAAIAAGAARENLPVALVFGIVHQESGFDPAAKSRSGARGLMQLMPGTGREVARKLGLPFSTARLADPDFSIRLGTTYFRQTLAQFDGRLELALAGYNGGPGRISRLWRASGPSPELDLFLEGLDLEESRNYVKRILVLAESYRSLYPELG
jgi:soluble lytic murein transglycosylase